MTQSEQISALSDDLDKLIERYRQEFDLTLSPVIGVLQVKIHRLISEVLEDEDHD